MDILFLVFAIISILIVLDGFTLKQEDSRSLVMRLLKTKQAKEKIALISNFMIGTGVLALIWTVIGYALYDLLIIELFLFAYFGIVFISGMVLILLLNKRFK